jgi:hypothetical protein
VAVAVGVSGVLLRLWLLGHAPMNSDEATPGLMAHEILHGHTYAFAWGQRYGGVEPYLLAAAFGIFGQSPFVLNATPAVLGLVTSLLVWRVGLRLFGSPAAVTAAVLSLVWSESALWDSTREYGYHEVCLLLSVVVLLETVRIVQRAAGRGRGDADRSGDLVLDWAVLGLAAGLGFWASPEIVYLAVPAAAVVAFALRGHGLRAVAVRVGAAVGSAIVGALPYVWSVLATPGGAGLPSSPVSYLSRLRTFFTHVLPMSLGLRVEGAGAWEGGRTLGILLTALVVALVVGAAVVLAVRVPDSRVLVLALGLYPFLYAAFPTSWFWNDGRYALALSPVLALVIAGGLFTVVRAPLAVWLASGVLLLGFASTLIAFNDGYGAISSPSQLTTFSTNPNPGVTQLASKLAALHVGRAYAGYWVANDLTFISDGHVAATALGFNRNPPGIAPSSSKPSAAKPEAWVFVPPNAPSQDIDQLGSGTDLQPGTVTEAALEAYLAAHAVPFRVVRTHDFDVVIPALAVRPDQVGA